MNAQNQGREYEKEVAKDYGGRTQPGSGSHFAQKSDVKTSKFLIEVKFTTKDSYILNYEDLVKCFNYAYRINRIPVFQIGFYGGDEFVILDQDSIEISQPAEVITVKPGAKSKTLNKELLKKDPKIKSMIYNKHNLLILPKKLFKEYLNDN